MHSVTQYSYLGYRTRTAVVVVVVVVVYLLVVRIGGESSDGLSNCIKTICRFAIGHLHYCSRAELPLRVLCVMHENDAGPVGEMGGAA